MAYLSREEVQGSWRSAQHWHLLTFNRASSSASNQHLERGGGGFQTVGVPTLVEKVVVVLLTLLFRVGAFKRPKKRQSTNRENPRKIGKTPPKQGNFPKRTKKKDRSGRTSPIREPHLLQSPHPAALELCRVICLTSRTRRIRAEHEP